MNALCLHCRAPFAPAKRSSRFCSKRCAGLFQNAQRRKAGEPVQRFWASIAKRSADECWPWQGGTTEGYGQIRFYGEKLGAHVVSFRLAHGSIPAGLMVLHRCGNRLCCNPGHLYAGNHADNTNDAVRHGTWRGGRRKAA